jgi:type II secretory pathway component PulF
MPTFSYTARDTSGNSVSGIIEAAEQRGAAAALREQGLWPTRIDAAAVTAAAGASSGTLPTAAPGLPPAPAPLPDDRMGAQTRIDAAPFLMGVPLPDLAAMYEQLATLQNAGVPLVQSLTTLGEQTRHPRLRSILQECARSVAGGNPLSQTMQRYPNVFNGIQMEMIRAGEASGMLELMCRRLAAYLLREIEIRRKLKRETLYPKIVLFLAGCVVLLLTFLRSGAATMVDRVKLGFTVAALAFFVWWLARFLNQFPAVGAAWDYVKLLIPGPGGVARRYATARFTRALGTLYAGGVLLPNAVAIAARSCGNRAIGERLLSHVPLLHAGQGISGMLAASGLLSPIAIQMARTGEQTGNLDGMMEKVSDYLEGDADVKAHQLAVVSGVAALLIAACVVLYIAVTFYMGSFSQAVNAAGG